MTDQELLELAAKAAGYESRFYGGDADGWWVFGARERGGYWNPLTDDGDALRLAVKLRLYVDCSLWESKASNGVTTEQREAFGVSGDPYAATRRAIVRAAAEIGKGIVQPITGDVPEDNYYKTQTEDKP